MRRYGRVARCWVVCGTLAAGLLGGCASTGPGARPAAAIEEGRAAGMRSPGVEKAARRVSGE